jgi:ribosomal protein S18 acetylase RimI-like enzyme
MSTKEKAVNLRRMARSDIDSVLEIDRKIGGGRGLITYRDMVAVDPGGALDLSFVAEVGGKMTGFILARLTYVGVPFVEIAIIQAVVVDPDYQHRGVASQLVNALLGHCHAEGVNAIRAVVDEGNADLKRFFQRLGFRRSELVNYLRTFEA